MKSLRDILYKAGMLEVIGNTDRNITSVCFDSRKAEKDCLFVAVKGTQVDGRTFIPKVIEKGAAAIVCEEFPVHKNADVTYIKVQSSNKALGFIASNFYDHPSEHLKLIGVTGTNGKTTTVTLLHQLFTQLGFKCGLISTVKIVIGEEIIPATHTTPDALSINALLARMLLDGCTHCFMEVSSHAVAQHRTTGLIYAGGIFTNITHDHLDYHKTFDEYIKAKKGFFDQLPENAFALVNADDRNSGVMVQNTKAIKKTFSLRSMSDFKCKVIENSFAGLLLNMDGTEVLCKLIGSFNAYNLLGIYATSVLLGIEKIKVLSVLSTLSAVDGRFEYIVSSNKITGIIDYAHTPDALENVLKTIKDIRTGNEKVITIIGCGGDRDAAKRPLMAKIACELSDKVFFTSDNPRSEDPQEIIHQMEKGVPPIHFKKTISIANRREAVKAACAMAAKGDIILLAGKGHEKYQEIKGVKHPFDDKEVLKESFKLLEA